MRKAVLQFVKAFPVIAGIITTLVLPGKGLAQQYIVADKDNTHPEQTRPVQPATFSSFTAERYDGYNEIRWTTLQDKDARKFIVEYSFDGVNYEAAGEELVSPAPYVLKHYITDQRPILYRLKTERLDGRFAYSANVALDGVEIAPVKVYPTIVTGNLLNVNASWPVERVSIVSANGTQFFTKEISGQSDYMRLDIPSLSKGMYWVIFYGDGWKNSTKILVP